MLTSSIFLSSCATTVQIKDEEFCGDEGPLGADCFYMFSPNTRSMTKEQWDAERFGQACIKSSAVDDIKKELLELCNESHACTRSEVTAVKRLSLRMRQIERAARMARR